MTEIKTSKLLSKLIEDSREIGNKRNPPFTAERFIVAIINKLNSSVGDIAGQDIADNKNIPLFVYCFSGGRSRQAASMLQHMGYNNVQNIGGITAYSGKVER